MGKSVLSSDSSSMESTNCRSFLNGFNCMLVNPCDITIGTWLDRYSGASLARNCDTWACVNLFRFSLLLITVGEILGKALDSTGGFCIVNESESADCPVEQEVTKRKRGKQWQNFGVLLGTRARSPDSLIILRTEPPTTLVLSPHCRRLSSLT